MGILLCGGSATRFGGDKLLAGTPPIAAQAARNLLAAVPRVLAVVPAGRAALMAMLEGAGCEVLETDRTTAGMGSTLAAGIEASAGAPGWIVALGDMPSVRTTTIAALRQALEAGATIAAPVNAEGRRGHPVGFSSALRAELVSLGGDVGARGILQRHASDVRPVRVDDDGIFIDVDTREDLGKLEGNR
ncbi:MAG TPA: nucleotidyltransferase family protein [Usitatibacter sp.]|nr:nucleotidyltransferase family protein [Usitatibacter sp.]